MIEQGNAGELKVREDARLDVGEDRLRDRKRRQLFHCGQQVRLAPGRLASSVGVGLLACPDDQLAVDLVRDVVQPLAQLGHKSGLVAGQVSGQQCADLVDYISTSSVIPGVDSSSSSNGRRYGGVADGVAF